MSQQHSAFFNYVEKHKRLRMAQQKVG